jgi:hypothetical protein
MEKSEKYVKLISQIAETNIDAALNICYQIIKKAVNTEESIGYQGDYRVQRFMEDLDRFYLTWPEEIFDKQYKAIRSLAESIGSYYTVSFNSYENTTLHKHYCIVDALRAFMNLLTLKNKQREIIKYDHDPIIVNLESFIQHATWGEEQIVEQIFKEYEDGNYR